MLIRSPYLPLINSPLVLDFRIEFSAVAWRLSSLTLTIFCKIIAIFLINIDILWNENHYSSRLVHI